VSDVSLQPILILLSQSAAGNPSQYMVEKAFAKAELDWRYLSAEVTADQLEDAVRGIRALGFQGGNCARPHNRAVAPLLDRLEGTAERIGAVNFIRRDGDDLVGENTEGQGLLLAIKAQREAPVGRALVFGTGDFARAVAVELAQGGAEEILILGRDSESAQALAQLLADAFSICARSAAWDENTEPPEHLDLIVNATPVGTQGVDGRLPIPWDTLASDALVADANLEEPHPTLLEEAAQRGLATVHGLDIYLEQAALNIQHWTGVEPDRTVIREAVEEFLEL